MKFLLAGNNLGTTSGDFSEFQLLCYNNNNNNNNNDNDDDDDDNNNNKCEGSGTKINEANTGKYLKVNYKNQRLMKHQLFTSDGDVQSWLKFLNK